MDKEPKLKQPQTQEDVDDAFEMWLELAEDLGITKIYEVINYFCPDDSSDEVRAITFAVDKEALRNHANMILTQLESEENGTNGGIWHKK